MSHDPWGKSGAYVFFAGQLMNAGVEDLGSVNNIIGSTFHLTVNHAQRPFQMRGSIGLVYLERSGELTILFGPPQIFANINNRILPVSGVKRYPDLPQWRLITDEARGFRTIQCPIEFSILKRNS